MCTSQLSNFKECFPKSHRPVAMNFIDDPGVS